MVATSKIWVRQHLRIVAILTLVLLVAVAGCSRTDGPAKGSLSSTPLTLTIGLGNTTGLSPQGGTQQTARNIALEGLIAFGRDGRPQAWLAEAWSLSADGLTLGVRLRPGVTFHNGSPVTATALRDVMLEQLPQYVGAAFDDIEQIRTPSTYNLEFQLRRRSNFVLEGLDVLIQAAGGSIVGTGPFSARDAGSGQFEMRANANYYGGTPFIDRILIQPYTSVRSAWADMLRGRVDMLYEVGVDALDSLEPSTGTKIFTFPRPYAYIVMLNLRRPFLRDPSFRQRLNAAVDREALVNNVLNGHGTPADGPVSPYHWAYTDQLPKFGYKPVALSGPRLRFSCLFADASMERFALELQRQLQVVGVDLELELVSIDKWYERIQAEDFDTVLADAALGPTLVRQYLFWHSKAPRNWGHFNSSKVDAALDAIRHAPDDETYKRSVAAFQKAIVDDPPAIFLTWGQRARAVSTRFEVPVEPGRDILPTTLRFWRLAADRQLVNPN